MSPNCAAKKASAHLNDDVTAKVLPDGTVLLGWEYRTTERIFNPATPRFPSYRWTRAFDVMGQGATPEQAVADLIAGFEYEEEMVFVEIPDDLKIAEGLA
jgi:hypothetical protein